uniref:LAGLIDADG endonuclease n=1 Tax=Chrysoporthe austroafricana TaxID=354353 RepID=A0A191MWV2_9PEZI|nr:LAGLIDADG endonuclease [Chrysoporthe austroafricana]AMX22084.1 LAGLIDADG endonuclease [Chrysoporthe austroafricana]
MERGEHLTEAGLQSIVNLRYSINWGLTEVLRSEFPNITPVIRPTVVDLPLSILSASDCEWVAGFTSGEGCFKLGIKASPRSKVGFQTYLAFYISQHSRDDQLMGSFVNFFGCGYYKSRGEKLNSGDYYCTSFTDIEGKIIPFFHKYLVRGVKFFDFQAWCRVAEMMQKGDHKTPEGLEIIRQIKSGMNRGR